jgi:hypothetical protein
MQFELTIFALIDQEMGEENNVIQQKLTFLRSQKFKIVKEFPHLIYVYSEFGNYGGN